MELDHDPDWGALDHPEPRLCDEQAREAALETTVSLREVEYLVQCMCDKVGQAEGVCFGIDKMAEDWIDMKVDEALKAKAEAAYTKSTVPGPMELEPWKR